MTISKEMSDKAVLLELGSRIARYRLNKNMTQEALAMEAGVSVPTIQRLEKGRSTQLSNFIRVLRALDLFERIDGLAPAPVISPIQQAKMRGKVRQRASLPSKEKQVTPSWSWGDKE
ncbi:MAG: helix-turn-helix domain-containing protein [Pseudomonadales bacterium]|nr:helix-turn-helix domain-containing protein [Pseudomonadales bacterium]